MFKRAGYGVSQYIEIFEKSPRGFPKGYAGSVKIFEWAFSQQEW